ncbi:MAG: hypothetical protein MRJ92_09090 [Nitrospira sp.]|nr:hypothetical protein [Nitrospira sp.]
MQLSWHIIIAAVSAVLLQSAANMAEAGSDRLTTYEPQVFLLAQASPGGEPTEATEFNISPQPLGSAITAFADQANYRLLVPAEMAEGKSTNGVSGRHTPEEALTILLAGTGLGHRLTDSRTMTLEPVAVTPLPPSPVAQAASPEPSNPNTQVKPASKPVKVPEIVVKEVEDRGYAVDESSTATRIPAPIHDTPRSVEVVTRQVLDDQKSFASAKRSGT